MVIHHTTKVAESQVHAALEYLRLGFVPIPIKPRDKVPLIKWCDWQSRKPSESDILSWWKQNPDANVAILTGEISGIVALDLEAGADLGDRPIPPTPMQLTGGGGKHYLFRHPGFPVPNAVRIWEKVDLRGDGGYIVVAPSIHPSGRRYEWVIHPATHELSDPPQWLLELIRERSKSKKKDWKKIAQGVPEGQRNETLASYIGKVLAGLPEELWETAGWDAAKGFAQRCSPPLPLDEAREVFESIAKREAAKREVAGQGGTPAHDFNDSPQLIQVAATCALTDAGNAELIAHIAGDRIRYDHQRERWLLWNGLRWVPDADGEVDRIALEAARLRLKAAANAQDSNERKRLAQWAIQSESSYRRRAALDWAKSIKPIAHSGEGWDSNPWLLGVANGVLDLRNIELREARREDMITMSTHIAFNPKAQCPRWLKFLDEVFLSDYELIEFIQRAVGYSLTGVTTEQCLFLCYGTGSNGKSKFLDTLRFILGDYAANTPFSTFEDIPRGATTNDVAALYGKRLVTSSETKERARLNEARIKTMTGGDPITCRFLFREFFTYTPMFKLWLAVNHKPVVLDDSYGFWRRIRLIPFNMVFKGENEDKNIFEKLKAEAEGILAWAVEGLVAWHAQGLNPPKVVLEATEQYRSETDTIGEFIADRCYVSPEAWCSAGQLYEEYRRWAHENGHDEMTATAFGRRITERGFVRTHTKKGKIYHGIGLLDEQNLDLKRSST
mgnify:CR=1 FL=1